MLKSIRKKCIVFVFVFIAIYFMCMIISFIEYGTYKKINIFSEISECNVLDDLKVNDKSLVDRYIEDISYEDSYVYELKYDSNSFEIYAYEFKSVDDAKKYYSKVWGHTSEKEYDYNMAGGSFFTSELIVRNSVNVYRIEAGNAFAYTDIMQYLNSIFTVQVSE